ncbi:unnamed protein product [Soboliphyme baturini]|uniref:RRP15-like protein n=1 Tax=Soboliphyme baturini TaxID=241478 RepID=A0A183IY46_9BILA|nr:unnamed protein product [Soboliphyme baturini]
MSIGHGSTTKKLKRRKHLPKNWEELGRVKPDIGRDREGERRLRTIATKGVVQLFNAVRVHQKEAPVDEDFPKHSSKDGEFSVAKYAGKVLSTVKGAKTARSAVSDVKLVKNEKQLASTTTSKWEVLRDDYLTAPAMKHMKDWNKSVDPVYDDHSNDLEGTHIG